MLLIQVAAPLKRRTQRTEAPKITAVRSGHIQEGRSELHSYVYICAAGAT